MDTGQALRLLRNKLESSVGDNGIQDLFNALNHIPLSITQVTAYVDRRGPRMTISSYMDEFRKNNQKKANLLIGMRVIFIGM
jgi:hypothetical protein